MERVYLDHNATSSLKPCVRGAMVEAFDLLGNPSSIHHDGRLTRYSIDLAREKVAALVGVAPSQVFFTSGGTEANNWVINSKVMKHQIVSRIEHDSVFGAAKGAELLKVNEQGLIEKNEANKLINNFSNNALMSVMLANNETGVIQPISEIAAIARSKGVLVHTDAVQAAGKIPVDFEMLQVDFMTLSAHKIGGPTGIGALIVRDGIELSPLLVGGQQEYRSRAGTENICGIIGFGAAALAAKDHLGEFSAIEQIRDKLEARVSALGPVKIFGANAPRLPNTSLMAFPGVSAETLVMALDLEGVAVSSGAACSSGKIETSHVLTAMGFNDQAIRISFGWSSQESDADFFIEALERIYPRLTNVLAA